MASPYAPNEDPTTLFLERTFIAGDVITGTGYGIQLCMFVYCVMYLWSQRKLRRQAIPTLVCIAVMFIVETMYVAVQARTIQICYIDNRNYPGGPWQYFLDTQALPVNVMFYATLFFITFICDCIVLWRCWVIWTALGHITAYFVIAIPTLMVVASFIMGVLWTLQSSHPGLSLYSALPLAYGTAYYSISLSINIILTILIVVRLIQYRRLIMRSLPKEHAEQYLSIATVLVESAALYSVFALGFLITYAISNPINQIFLGIAQATQQISVYLIIYRLAEDKAWKADTLDVALTTMQFPDHEPERKTRTATTLTLERDMSGPDASPAISRSVVTLGKAEVLAV